MLSNLAHHGTAGGCIVFLRRCSWPYVCSRQIGSGIFSSPGVVVANAHSTGASLMVWLISGLLAWTGASSFAEVRDAACRLSELPSCHAKLGSSIPVNGGAQAYLAYAYGPLTSYLFAWTAIIALKPGQRARHACPPRSLSLVHRRKRGHQPHLRRVPQPAVLARDEGGGIAGRHPGMGDQAHGGGRSRVRLAPMRRDAQAGHARGSRVYCCQGMYALLSCFSSCSS
jgi:hypothetical protein